jgi:hypothetical protein
MRGASSTSSSPGESGRAPRAREAEEGLKPVKRKELVDFSRGKRVPAL